jgi:hypothetical protein
MARTDKKIQGRFERQKEAAIAALLVCSTVAEAAAQAQVGERTLHRWLNEDAAFQALYRDARRAVMQQVIASLQVASTKAVQTLKEVMADQESPASARVSAARTTLELAIRGIELDDLLVRIATLEAQLAAGQAREDRLATLTQNGHLYATD